MPRQPPAETDGLPPQEPLAACPNLSSQDDTLRLSRRTLEIEEVRLSEIAHRTQAIRRRPDR
jgi:hypothetical protein